MNFLGSLFSSDGFMPHGHCYLWNPGLVWLHVVSDGLIAAAYFSIPIALVYFARRRRDVEFHGMLISFALFIIACGATHLMEIWNIWQPTYWLSGAIKGVTAAASVTTAILLVYLMPRALAIPSPGQLRRVNEALVLEIAERKKAVEAAEALNAQLQRHATLLERANKELEAFSYSVSHDLRAPLRHIDGFVGLLLAGESANVTERGRRYLENVAGSARHMGALIDDLLAFSRNQRTAMRVSEVELTPLVDEAVSAVQSEVAGREVVWRKSALPAVSGDRAMLRQVFVNLLSNAVKYTRPRATAEIEIGCASDSTHEVVVFVRDNGVGFEMDYADKLFGVFSRLHRSEEFEGTGIGLANVRRIVERHGGRAWAEGKVDGGATFYFSLAKSTQTFS